MAESKFNVGDKVRCIPGFRLHAQDTSPLGGGSGYKEGKIFVIHRISEPSRKFEAIHKGNIYWPSSGSGIFEIALELYVPELPSNAEEISNNITKLIESL